MENADDINELVLDAIENTAEVLGFDEHMYVSYIRQFAK